MDTASPAPAGSSPSMKDMAQADAAPGQGSVLTGLKHKARVGAAAQPPKSAELQPHPQDPTPYSSILQLLREGPAHRGRERRGPHDDSRPGEAAPSASGVWASGPVRHHQTPAPRPPSMRPGVYDRQQMPRTGLFTMGVTPDPKSSIPRHRVTPSTRSPPPPYPPLLPPTSSSSALLPRPSSLSCCAIAWQELAFVPLSKAVQASDFCLLLNADPHWRKGRRCR